MLDRHDLRKISQTTLAHYDDTADAFWEGTRDHDVSQNVHALLSHLGTGPFRILDLGCGPGRDLRTFRDLAHEAVGLDGAARFVDMARDHSHAQPARHPLQLEPPRAK
jgi:predicted TPR repeat methyltransferase